jgi:asparagine synthase (glutamine-hydrolysing)
MTDSAAAGGVLAVSTSDDRPIIAALTKVATGIGGPDTAVWRSGQVQVASWGRLRNPQVGPEPMLLSEVHRGPAGDLPSPDLFTHDTCQPLVADLLPPFAAIQVFDDRVAAVTDAVGFRHMYYRTGRGWAAVSTSTRALAALEPARLDRWGLGFQSLLGWQIGDRTLVEGVHKLRDGHRITLSGGTASIERYERDGHPRGQAPIPNRTAAIREAAGLLRTYLAQYLDEHPDAVLQLTGGMDSRILLAAVDPARRKGLRALTLAGSPDAEDVRIASDLSHRYGMEHLVRGFTGMDRLEPGAAFELAVSAAHLLDGMADPLALAALSLFEGQVPQGDRISGLGGEVARGFYYMGPTVSMPVSRLATRILTDWRMFANEAVPDGVLEAGFAAEVRDFAREDVYRTLRGTGHQWLEATDQFYLYERMQRWGGVTASAVCLQRSAINPMLDRRFLDIASSLTPHDKSGAKFLAGLLCELDAELGTIPLDGRKAPQAYANPSWIEPFTRQLPVVPKVYGKLRQRVLREHRPPAGGQVLTELVVRHWREAPEVLDPARSTGVLDERWVAEVLGGDSPVEPSAAAFVTTLVAAQSMLD